MLAGSTVLKTVVKSLVAASDSQGSRHSLLVVAEASICRECPLASATRSCASDALPDPCAVTLVEAGAFPAILRTLAERSGDPHALTSACRAVQHIAVFEDLLPDEEFEAAVKALVALMEIPNELVKEAAIRALRDCAAAGHGLSFILTEGQTCLIDALDSTSLVLQENAAVVCALVYDGIGDVDTSELVEALLELLDPACPDMVKVALWALANTCGGSPDLHSQLVTVGAKPALFGALGGGDQAQAGWAATILLRSLQSGRSHLYGGAACAALTLCR